MAKKRISLVLSLLLFCGCLLFPAPAKAAAGSTLYLDGAPVYNAGANNYAVYADTVKSYLTRTADGGFTRACVTFENTLLVEWYSPEGRLTRAKTTAFPLPLFGGFHFGRQYNFAVFGQENLTDDPEAEVIRAVRYDKEMNRLDEVSLYGMNTYIPFDAGSCRFAEAGGRLYVFTCHEMFDHGDGKHHQANMTLIFDEAPLALGDGFSGVGTIAKYGYVSHSFNQFIATDGERIYRADHGDAYPRALSVTLCAAGEALGRNRYTEVFPLAGETGVNSTGATLGGIALTKDRVLLAATVDSQTADYTNDYDRCSNEQRNVIVLSSSRLLESEQNKTVRVTDYAADAGVEVFTPHLTRVDDDTALLMWEEIPAYAECIVVRAVLLDANGNPKTDISTLEARLSDCAPVLGADGCVYWYVSAESREMQPDGSIRYVSDGTDLILYRLDPARIDAFIPAKHNWELTNTVIPATCEAEGKGEFRCAVCGVTKTETLPALGHDWSRWSYENQSVHTRVCGNDASHVEREAHSWSTNYVTQPATCTSKGTGQIYCPVCATKLTGSVFPKLGHAWGAWEMLNEALHVRVCQNDASHTETAAHVWQETARTPPTETENGSASYACAVCGGTKSELLPATGAPFTPGDVDQNGTVNTSDARLALRAAIGLEHYAPGTAPFRAADVEAPAGMITTADARTILRAAIGLTKL